MTLNQLHYLLTIHECGSITKAAQELFVSAPSISTAIKNLEEELGCTLILRHRNGVSFTEQGEKAVEVAQSIEKSIDVLHHLKEMKDQTLYGQIRFGSAFSCNYSFSIPLMIYMTSVYPNVHISIAEDSTPNIIERIAQKSLDLGLIVVANIDEEYCFREIRRHHLQYTKILDDELVFLVRKDHPLTQRSSIGFADILSYPYFVSGESDYAVQNKFFQSYNPACRPVHINDPVTLRSVLLQSDGCTPMPLSNVKGTLKQVPGMTYLSADDFVFQCQIGWVHGEESLSLIEKVIIAELQFEANKFQ